LKLINNLNYLNKYPYQKKIRKMDKEAVEAMVKKMEGMSDD